MTQRRVSHHYEEPEPPEDQVAVETRARKDEKLDDLLDDVEKLIDKMDWKTFIQKGGQ